MFGASAKPARRTWRRACGPSRGSSPSAPPIMSITPCRLAVGLSLLLLASVAARLHGAAQSAGVSLAQTPPQAPVQPLPYSHKTHRRARGSAALPRQPGRRQVDDLSADGDLHGLSPGHRQRTARDPEAGGSTRPRTRRSPGSASIGSRTTSSGGTGRTSRRKCRAPSATARSPNAT